jgi:hypothetical protein
MRFACSGRIYASNDALRHCKPLATGNLFSAIASRCKWRGNPYFNNNKRNVVKINKINFVFYV